MAVFEYEILHATVQAIEISSVFNFIVICLDEARKAYLVQLKD